MPKHEECSNDAVERRSRQALPRWPPYSLSEDQARLYRRITMGPRGREPRVFEIVAEDGALLGPFRAMLVNPELGLRLEALGRYLRFQSRISPAAREVAILAIAYRWRSKYETYAHAACARAVGLSQISIDAVLSGDKVVSGTGEESAAYDLVKSLMQFEDVSDELYARTVERLGLNGCAEVVALIGYYSALAALEKVFGTYLPEKSD